MGVQTVVDNFKSITAAAGRAALNSMYPNDFEYYALSLELVDDEFNTKKIFNFPVMPNGISVKRSSPSNIKKSGFGYFTQYSDTFQAYNISISGTFGRKFRLLVRKDADSSLKDFDLNVKTGYGATKVLEDIILSSQQMVQKTTEQGVVSSHQFLFLYNYTFNQQFVVEVVDFQVQQSLENNVMFNFNIELKAIGDVTKIAQFDVKKHLKNLLVTSVLNKTVNTILSDVTSTAGGVGVFDLTAAKTKQSQLTNGFTF